MCHVSCVTCCVSPVTCHMSLMPTATFTDPPPANFPNIHIRLVSKDPKKSKSKRKHSSKPFEN